MRNRNCERLLLICLFMPTAGCGPSDVKEAGMMAGAYEADPQGEVNFVIQEDLRLGSGDESGPEVFAQIKGIAVDQEGKIAVLEGHSQELRLFHSDGRHSATFGGRGSGPGELSGAHGVVWGPDGLFWVADPANARMSRFHPVHGHVSDVPMSYSAWGWYWGGVVDTAGKVWDTQMIPSPHGPQPVLRGFSPTLGWTDTVRLNRNLPAGFASVYRQGRGAIRIPFHPIPRHVLDGRGHQWVTKSDQYRIAKTALGGDTILVIEGNRPIVGVTAGERDSAMAAVLPFAEVGRTDLSRIPNEHPQVGQLSVDDSGRLWVRVTTQDHDLITYDIYSPEGRFSGTATTTIVTPASWRPLIVDSTYNALAIIEHGIPIVVRGRIRAVPSSAAGKDQDFSRPMNE